MLPAHIDGREYLSSAAFLSACIVFEAPCRAQKITYTYERLNTEAKSSLAPVISESKKPGPKGSTLQPWQDFLVPSSEL